MGVGGLVAAFVADADILPVTAIAPGRFDRAVTRGVDRRAARRGEVDAAMHLGVAENGVPPPSEAGRDPGAVDRRQDQRLADAVALFVVIIGVAIARTVAIETDPLAAQHHFGDQDIAFRDRCAGVVVMPFEHQVERVVRLHVALEVYVETEDADQPRQDRRRQFRALPCEIEARADDTAGARRMGRQRLFDDRSLEAAGFVPAHRDVAARIDGEVDPLQRPIRRRLLSGYGDRGPGLQVARLENLRKGHDRRMRFGPRNFRAGQKRHQGIAGRYGQADRCKGIVGRRRHAEFGRDGLVIEDRAYHRRIGFRNRRR